MSDRIVLANMRFMGRHGYYEHELETEQPFEVDVELILNLQPAGMDDDLRIEKTRRCHGSRIRLSLPRPMRRQSGGISG